VLQQELEQRSFDESLLLGLNGEIKRSNQKWGETPLCGGRYFLGGLLAIAKMEYFSFTKTGINLLYNSV